MSPFYDYSLNIVFYQDVNFSTITLSDSSFLFRDVTCRPLGEWQQGFTFYVTPNLMNRS